MDIQSTYQETIKFAAEKHEEINQKIPGTNITYIVHLSNVAMEIIVAKYYTEDFDINFAIQVALLHDILEDTNTSFEELNTIFGKKIADAVHALTKNKAISDKSLKMDDSLLRIKSQPKEVWAVKLADRITNLQKPPNGWSQEKIKNYSLEATKILSNLKDANSYLEKRLESKIAQYIEAYVS